VGVLGSSRGVLFYFGLLVDWGGSWRFESVEDAVGGRGGGHIGVRGW